MTYDFDKSAGDVKERESLREHDSIKTKNHKNTSLHAYSFEILTEEVRGLGADNAPMILLGDIVDDGNNDFLELTRGCDLLRGVCGSLTKDRELLREEVLD